MALPKANRLKSHKDFQAVFREGLRRQSANLTLRALKPSLAKTSSLDTATPTESTIVVSHLPNTLIAVSISTKVSKKAVVRNRLKRQITAAFQKLLPKLAPGWKLVIIVKPTVIESKCGSQQFLQELEQLLAQTEVLNGHS